jgi:hypothetical protein
MRQVDGFLRVLRFLPPIKLTSKQMTLIKYPILLYWYFVLIHSCIFWLWDTMFPLLVDLRACYLCKNCYEMRSYIAAGQHQLFFLKQKRAVCILSQYILYLYQIALHIWKPSTLYYSCNNIKMVDFSTLYRCTIFSTLNIKTD